MRNFTLWLVSAMVIGLLLLAGFLVLSQFVLGPSVAQAQPAAQTAPTLPRTITVVGEGNVKIKPDVAQANIGVEVMQPSVKEASKEAEVVMKAILATLKEQGIADKDIQTSGYSIWLDRPYGPEGMPSDEPIYHLNNNVTVTIRDLDTVGGVLDAVIEAGANNIYGITFSLDDPSQVESQAREKAVADAKAKAQELAELNGLKVGEVISVSEVVGGAGGFYMSNFREASALASMGGGGGPISPGELSLNLQLEIVYSVQ